MPWLRKRECTELKNFTDTGVVCRPTFDGNYFVTQINMSHVMRKPGYAICEQQRRRLACASVQSDQRLLFAV